MIANGRIRRIDMEKRGLIESGKTNPKIAQESTTKMITTTAYE